MIRYQAAYTIITPTTLARHHGLRKVWNKWKNICAIHLFLVPLQPKMSVKHPILFLLAIGMLCACKPRSVEQAQRVVAQADSLWHIGQMAAMVDNGHCAFYGYDGNGVRTYKLTGTTSIDQYNAGEETFHMNFNDAVIYVNPYFTITPRNYTSHIMNGSQRIATRIGTNGLTNCIDTANAGAERIANARAYMQALFAQGIELHPDTTATFVPNDRTNLCQMTEQICAK